MTVVSRDPVAAPRPRGRLLLAIALALALALPAAANAAAPLSWTGPAGSMPRARGPVALSCPSSGLCVAVDAEGDALVSTDPFAAEPAWRSIEVDLGHALAAVSCPSTSLCVAVDAEGDAVLSTDPTATSPASWRTATIDPGQRLTGISCPSTSLCVAIDVEGDAVLSTDPTASPASWKAATIDARHRLTGISCASPTLCVAIDAEGDALAASEPRSASSWTAQPIGHGAPLIAISCASSGLCVALDEAGTAFASADPAAPNLAQPSVLGPTWSSTKIDSSTPTAISCAASGLCVALDRSGRALASDAAAGALPSWGSSVVQRVAAAAPLTALACMPDGRCLALGAPAAPLSGSLQAFAGAVPAPSVLTGAATSLGSGEVTLNGTVNPADAVLGACQFEYGRTSAYGDTVPCAFIPPSLDSAEPVSATLAGLTPGLLYHYRLIASSGAGSAAGADQTFRVGPPPSLVYPKPSISGTPAVGRQLTCNAHLPGGAGATLSYVWLRGLVVISGATSRTYEVQGSDAGHHLQCRVTATDPAGSITRTSRLVAIPVKGVLAAVGETAVARASIATTRVEVAVSCSKQAPEGCTIDAKLTVTETKRGRRIIAIAAGAGHPRRAQTAGHAAAHTVHHARSASRRAGGPHARRRRPPPKRRVTVKIGGAHVHLKAGHDRVVKVFLNREGRRLLRGHAHGMQAELTVTGTVVGVITVRLRHEAVTLATAAHAASRGGRRHARSGASSPAVRRGAAAP